METPSTLSATGRCKHWLSGDYIGKRGCCPLCEIEHLRQWQNDAAGVMAQFITLSAHHDEQEWAQVALEATRLINMPSNAALTGATPNGGASG